MTRTTVSVPGQDGSVQLISLTDSVASDGSASASRVQALMRLKAPGSGLRAPKGKRLPRAGRTPASRGGLPMGPSLVSKGQITTASAPDVASHAPSGDQASE